MKKNFLIVVDAQNDFMLPDGALYVKGAENCIGPINNLLDSLRPETTGGVLFTYDTHDFFTYVHSKEGKEFPPHCLYRTEGWNLAVNPFLVHCMIPRFTLE